MTIATLMATSLIFIGIGWTGDFYQPIALVVGSIVCIAASNAGATSQDLKTGYIVGATPAKQQLGLLIGVLVSTVAIGFTLLLLNDTLGIGVVTEAHPNPLPAPQATLMATVIKGLLSQNLPWGLVIAGMGLSAVVELCGVSSLAFAVGAYLPLSTTSPIFVGGMIKLIADKVTKRKEGESEVGSGALFSSGLIAGGSLTGILVAVLLGTNVDTSEGPQSVIAVIHHAVHGVIPEGGDLVAILMFSIMAYIVFRFAKAKVE
jgi:putative OPT family oligopeptide transporter